MKSRIWGLTQILQEAIHSPDTLLLQALCAVSIACRCRSAPLLTPLPGFLFNACSPVAPAVPPTSKVSSPEHFHFPTNYLYNLLCLKVLPEDTVCYIVDEKKGKNLKRKVISFPLHKVLIFFLVIVCDKHLQSQLHVQGAICCADSMRKETARLSFLISGRDFTGLRWTENGITGSNSWATSQQGMQPEQPQSCTF